MATKTKAASLTPMIEDLRRSGLGREEAKTLGLKLLTADELDALLKHRYGRPGYVIPYWSLSGEPLEFFRVRFLDDQKPKYTQPKSTGVYAYFPPFIDWLAIAADPTKPVLLTEGEKKSAKACKDGIPCIGLGGVWSFQSKKRGRGLIDELDLDFVWKDRQVVVVYDQDPKDNPDVMLANERVCRTLEQRGADVEFMKLPRQADQAKVGLDDYLLMHSVEEFNSLPREKLPLTVSIEALNSEVGVIMDSGFIVNLATAKLYKASILEDSIFANRLMEKLVNGKLVKVKVFKEWKESARRLEFHSIVYEPGSPRTTAENNYNRWTGWGVEPKKGDVAYFKKLLEYLFNGDHETRKWFLQWLAYPLQHPGTKMYTASVLWSRDHGTGKSLIGHTMKPIYGDNWQRIEEHHIHKGFNIWQANKQFVLGDEVTGSDKRREADRLKSLITNEWVLVNPKGIDEYMVRDCNNYLFTSNRPDAFYLDEKDRRFMIKEVGVGVDKPPEKWFTEEYHNWYNSPEGAGALFHYLLNIDLAGFDPRAKAPATDSKTQMIELGGTDVDHLVKSLVDAPEMYLRLGDTPYALDLITYEQLIQYLDPDGRMRFTRPALSKAFAILGISAVQTQLKYGSVKLIPIRNVAKWQKASHAERVAHYQGEKLKKEKF